jgi:predicted lipid-binding transport protein (Tim44 family)
VGLTVSEDQTQQSSFAGWMGSMWLYTILRFGLFFALWGVLILAGVHGFIAALVAVALSVPLSFVLLSVPRARFAANIERRVNAHRDRRADLDAQLDPKPDADHG